MSTFGDALRSGRVLLMDGAMGTELQKLGLKPGECGEEWNVTHPNRVGAIHRCYAESGAEVLLTNTFQAIAAVLKGRSCEPSPNALVEAAVNLARVHGKWVLGDLGPFDDAEFYDAGEKRLIRPCSDVLAAMNSCDAILVETLSHLAPLVKALYSEAHGPNHPPFLASATYMRDGNAIRTYAGLTPEHWARQVKAHPGIVAVGVNCGREIGMKECVEIVHRSRQYAFARVRSPKCGYADFSRRMLGLSTFA
jgi:5-methyltetrahydrofolate--homocysteine methyltransferase